jgi:D-glycero-D-manno-heptose 1,7-bisphosphate phosphatase
MGYGVSGSGTNATDPSPDTRSRAIFFDRDGVVNARIIGGYVRHWNEFELLPGVADVLREIKGRGYLAIIVTNQRGVGMGLMSEADLHSVHNQLQEEMLRLAGCPFDDIIFATDVDDTSGRRKPAPTMLIEASEKWNIDLSQSWMIGDSMSDIEAGQRAGTMTAYLITQHSEEIPKATTDDGSSVKIVHELKEILRFI